MQTTSQRSQPGDVDVIDEIHDRLALLRAEASAYGRPLLAPLLALGTSERVGSNWLSDTLRSVYPQHNEPLRQQITANHPLSTLNLRILAGPPVTAKMLGGLGIHWLSTFVTSSYATTRHVVKETNLFFATPWLLRLFPDSPVVVLSRSPLGVASSFRRSGLFSRWGYAGRYAQLVNMTRRKPWRRWSPLVPDDRAADELAMLVRLVVLNTLLLAESLTGRDVAHISYEHAIRDHQSALAALHGVLPDFTSSSAVRNGDLGPATVDDTFTTAVHKDRLVAYLSPAEARVVRAESTRCLAVASHVAAPRVVANARARLHEARHYTLLPGRAVPAPRRPADLAAAVPVRYVRINGLYWRNVLVTNREFCDFVNSLRNLGLVNTVRGTQLLFTEMPYARGGRVYLDPATGRHQVAGGYDDHPVYWVTWIGAAAFAAHAGASLPTRRQAQALAAASGVPVGANADYRVGDTTAAFEPLAGPDQVHHRVGNLQLWCADGPPAQLPQAGLTRYLHGAAWNTPSTPHEIDQPRSRHLLGTSRGVGIRLIRKYAAATAGVPVGESFRRLTAWISALDDRRLPATILDQLIVDALTGSQADVRLGPHVAASTREPAHG